MNVLVTDLLDFSRLETKKTKLTMVPFSLHQLITETIEDVSFQVKNRGITLHHALSCDNDMLTADRERIKQVLSNLISNAIKFTEAGGAITVKAVTTETGEIEITVADTGIGIPEDKIDKVFQKFYQVDGSSSRKHAGFGLGLAIVKSLVEGHDGKVWVESTLGTGSTFHVVLPREGHVPAGTFSE